MTLHCIGGTEEFLVSCVVSLTVSRVDSEIPSGSPGEAADQGKTLSHVAPAVQVSGSEAAQSNKFRIILIILLLTSVTCIMLTLIQVIRQKACRVMLLAKGIVLNTAAQDRKMCANDKSSISTEQSDDADGPDSGSLDMEGMCHALYNSNLPLPSTEEGTTVLVTTKTCNL
ncbi:hypothetical protein P4O66_010823 [Electrophorus voltai]|uniref:Uncharacterized protein n=1 Tax=Electrophorus voltai TaxID=2609070 RepID=A0AAD8Z7G3_9TELE|nr:hypothetical protein P4O66_010823 [Electrophorus voltai]